MKPVLDAEEIKQAIQKIAREILEEEELLEKVVLVGITTRGVPLSQRVGALLKEAKGIEVPAGVLDMTLYRDDLSRLSTHPVVRRTEIPFSIDGKSVFLLDDVLYTGRTIRGALNALFDLGRPDRVGLAVLVDRGGREIPIEAGIVGIHVEAKKEENVVVKLKETDGEEGVFIE